MWTVRKKTLITGVFFTDRLDGFSERCVLRCEMLVRSIVRRAGRTCGRRDRLCWLKTQGEVSSGGSAQMRGRQNSVVEMSHERSTCTR